MQVYIKETNMALNAAKKKSTGGGKDFVEQPLLEEGTYKARVVQIIELGLQPQRAYQGKEKPPVDMLYITYELADEFMLDEAGEEIEDKPRWMSEDFPYYSLECDMAKCNKRLKAIDPKNKVEGDWARVCGAPCNVTFSHAVKGDKTYVNVAAVTSVRDKDIKGMPKLVNPPKVFDIDEPDMEIFEALPKWLQDKIKGNLNYKGSVLEDAVNGGSDEQQEEEPEQEEEPKKSPKPKKEKAPEKGEVDEEEEDDDNPW